ncbi:MAG: hypothetical protein LBR84_11650 [Tannerella sp.]|nr:hypothetical protein [Tannerella sp.]
MQNEAKQRIGRRINDEEIEIATDGIEWGISDALDITYNTIFTEMIKK